MAFAASGQKLRQDHAFWTNSPYPLLGGDSFATDPALNLTRNDPNVNATTPIPVSVRHKQQDLTITNDALELVAAIAMVTTDLLAGRPAEQDRMTPEDIWRDWERIASRMPVIQGQLSALLGHFRQRGARKGLASSYLAARVERRLADGAWLAGLTQAVAYQSYQWLDTLACDLEAFSLELESAALQVELDAEADA